VSEPTGAGGTATVPALLPARPPVVRDHGGVRLHTFTAPDEFLANSTHIVETEHALVLVDGQFVAPYALYGQADG